ncbi:YpiB family protein [Staphylococcus coagulans]|uniref:YpiB family protein n=1 Tax=Staphylococcus coagulans TaxID=74706 RepID=A0ABU1EW72_9STAP|nr:YpiB family protein [Staphylococcus coagulans]MDR5602382.1 YpiB family protein [Staphylococcus coagulans]MDR9831825.1 YpiB family protein [Staphylococcus coagulans]
MYEVHLNYEKRNIIDYLLFHYQFKSRISVWILNLIRSNSERLERIHFVDHIVQGHPTLEIATEDAPFVAIKYHDTHTNLMNSNEIFHNIVKHDDIIDIKIHFGHTSQRDKRMDRLLLHQIITSYNSHDYLKDMYTIELSKNIEHQLILTIQSQIDLSLNMNDVEAFHHYSNVLNLLKLRHMND